jgi:hypothetical protein
MRRALRGKISGNWKKVRACLQQFYSGMAIIPQTAAPFERIGDGK